MRETTTVVHQVAKDVSAAGFARFSAVAALPTGDNLEHLWSDLPLDPFMADGDQFRRRRFGRFHATKTGLLWPAAYEAYYEETNAYVGDQMKRDFPELSQFAYNSSAIRSLLTLDLALVTELDGNAERRIGLHLIRISADTRPGLPTPEGPHHDGVQFFVIHLVGKTACGGTTRIYDNAGQLSEQFVLRDYLDSMIVEDARLMHDVSPIHSRDGELRTRDILIVDFYPNPQR